MRSVLANSKVGLEGVNEVQTVINKVLNLGLESADLDFDLTLARGLNYYTGSIFEVEAKGVQMGSIGGGGRYDDLTGVFGLKDLPGIGISFGLDRIYLVLEELDVLPSLEADFTQVLFVNFGEKEADYCLNVLSELRKAGINSELYPDSAKMKKQMNYANKKNIPYREFNINKFNEQTIGELFAYFILETGVCGKLINVNPFDQPAVEEVKIITKKLLS